MVTMRRSIYLSVIIVLLAFFCNNFINKSIKKENYISIFDDFGGFKNKSLVIIPINGGIGPESLVFDPNGGGPYTGVSNGRIIKWQPEQRQWLDFAVTSPMREKCDESHNDNVGDAMEHICGRPLGLCFHRSTGDLYIADAYMGLLKVGSNGGLANKIATHVQDIPFGFTNGLDIDQSSGVIYFTDTSTRYQRRNHISVIISGDKTGRLMKYDPKTEKVSVLLDNLLFPNGVTLSKDGNYILLAETTKCRILKYWVKTSKVGKVEMFADQLPGFPDNIKRSPRGGFWVGIHSKKDKTIGYVISKNWVNKLLLKLPIGKITKLHSILGKYKKSNGFAIRLSEDGDVLETLEDEVAKLWKSISEVEEKDGVLWIGSIKSSFVGMYTI